MGQQDDVCLPERHAALEIATAKRRYRPAHGDANITWRETHNLKGCTRLSGRRARSTMYDSSTLHGLLREEEGKQRKQGDKKEKKHKRLSGRFLLGAAVQTLPRIIRRESSATNGEAARAQAVDPPAFLPAPSAKPNSTSAPTSPQLGRRVASCVPSHIPADSVSDAASSRDTLRAPAAAALASSPLVPSMPTLASGPLPSPPSDLPPPPQSPHPQHSSSPACQPRADALESSCEFLREICAVHARLHRGHAGMMNSATVFL